MALNNQALFVALRDDRSFVNATCHPRLRVFLGVFVAIMIVFTSVYASYLLKGHSFTNELKLRWRDCGKKRWINRYATSNRHQTENCNDAEYNAFPSCHLPPRPRGKSCLRLALAGRRER